MRRYRWAAAAANHASKLEQARAAVAETQQQIRAFIGSASGGSEDAAKLATMADGRNQVRR
eukprot:9482096-Pyramimonas_sp.AAC.2